MPNVFTLDALRAEVDKEFAPFVIPLSDGSEVTLRNPLRLADGVRKQVFDILSSIGDADKEEKTHVDDLSKLCTKVITLVGTGNIKQLIKEVDGDVALLIQIIETWTEETQLGEAENSPASSTDTASS